MATILLKLPLDWVIRKSVCLRLSDFDVCFNMRLLLVTNSRINAWEFMASIKDDHGLWLEGPSQFVALILLEVYALGGLR